MSNYELDQIRATLPTADDLLRRRTGRFPQADRPVRSPVLASLHDGYSGRLESLLAVEDRGDLDQIREQYQAEARRLHLEKKHNVLNRKSSATLDTLQSRLATWRKTTEDMASRQDIPLNFIALDTPGLVLPIGDADVRAIVAPWNTVAKISAEWTSTPPQFQAFAGVAFVFAWTNPTSTSAVLNVDSYLGLNGFCTVAAEGGFLANNFTELWVDVSLGLYTDPNNPTYPPYQYEQNVTAGDLLARGGGLFGLGEVQSLAIAGEYGVAYRSGGTAAGGGVGAFVVPPGEAAVFLVTFSSALSMTGGGFADVDFASDSFQVFCPALVFAIV